MGYLDGAYRLHRQEDVARFTALAIEAFPDFTDRIECFGADWLGRQFATDERRIVDGAPQVLMLEPGTGEVLEIPVNRAVFHDDELANEPDAAAAYSFFQQWLEAGGTRPNYDQCIGYKLPLYLGGTDDVSNLSLIDFSVYWTLSAQTLARVRGLPVGTTIRDVSISG
ncbi:T6SS immunity protein Tdi1 domain-containing protein [Novosphingobium aerophilum]|uniref:T6SS immunity protein Tdi1 domain-containing protein n=1 Tax=Novosphingobium aerophilum TaxID=2839843 RepID=UPI003FD20891